MKEKKNLKIDKRVWKNLSELKVIREFATFDELLHDMCKVYRDNMLSFGIREVIYDKEESNRY